MRPLGGAIRRFGDGGFRLLGYEHSARTLWARNGVVEPEEGFVELIGEGMPAGWTESVVLVIWQAVPKLEYLGHRDYEPRLPFFCLKGILPLSLGIGKGALLFLAIMEGILWNW